MCKTTERPCASPLSEEEFEEKSISEENCRQGDICLVGTRAAASPSQSVKPRSPVPAVHSGDVTVHSGPSECTVTSPECTDSDERGVMDWLGDTLVGYCTVVWPGQRRYR